LYFKKFLDVAPEDIIEDINNKKNKFNQDLKSERENELNETSPGNQFLNEVLKFLS
jgi:hypothetical protein